MALNRRTAEACDASGNLGKRLQGPAVDGNHQVVQNIYHDMDCVTVNCILLVELFSYTCLHHSWSSTRAAIADGYCPVELLHHLASDAALLAKDKTGGLLQQCKCYHAEN